MRVVAISDLHLDARLLGQPRIGEVDHALLKSVEVAKSKHADLWVFAGDLCDPDSGPIVFRAIERLHLAVSRLQKTGIGVVIVAGNHDVVEDGSGSSVLSPLRPLNQFDESGSVSYCVVAHSPVSCRLSRVDEDGYAGDAVQVHALPFAPASHAYDPVEFVQGIVDDGGKHLFVSHLNVEGVAPGSEESMPRGREVFLPRKLIGERFGKRATVLQGHYHQRQRFDPRDGGAAVQVIGAPARFTFGEETNDPAFLFLYV